MKSFVAFAALCAIIASVIAAPFPEEVKVAAGAGVEVTKTNGTDGKVPEVGERFGIYPGGIGGYPGGIGGYPGGIGGYPGGIGGYPGGIGGYPGGIGGYPGGFGGIPIGGGIGQQSSQSGASSSASSGTTSQQGYGGGLGGFGTQQSGSTANAQASSNNYNQPDRVFVTIYVNPTQFGVHEDLDSYPQTWDSDLRLLRQLNEALRAENARGRVEAVFAPTTKTMYPTLPPDSSLPGTGSFVTITPLANLLEGRSRPVFFRGVATVCMKLFNIVEPEKVFFGQKDVQQTVVIKRLVRDFHLNTQVKIVPTEREPDGMAMSSRNVYLGQRRRGVGIVLSQALRAAEAAYVDHHCTSRDEILAAATRVLADATAEQSARDAGERVGFEIDYISLADPETLEEIDTVEAGRGAVLSGAIKMLPLEITPPDERLGLGDDKVPVRLIDNIPLQPK